MRLASLASGAIGLVGTDVGMRPVLGGLALPPLTCTAVLIVLDRAKPRPTY